VTDAAVWQVTEEFTQRLGCGVLTAFILPPWFLLAVFAVSDDALAWTFAAAVFLLVLALAVVGRWRIRRLPRRIALVATGGAASLDLHARSGHRVVPLAGLREVRVTTSIGLRPVVLVFEDGAKVRLPRDLEDFAGFRAALLDACPGVRLIDRNPDQVEADTP